MTRMIIGALLLMFSAQAPSTAGAQTSADWMLKVKPGTPIFVTTVTGEVVEGISGRVRSDSMVVSTRAGVRIVLLPAVHS